MSIPQANGDDLTPQEQLEALSAANAGLSKLLAISEAQKIKLKEQVCILRDELGRILGEKT